MADSDTGKAGMTTGKVETLDKIGKNLKITRERVRQIEFAGRAVIRTALPKSFGKFSATVHDHLKHFDGVREEGRLLRELAYVLDEENVNSMHIKFLLSLDPSMMYVQETDSCAAFWTDAPKIADKVFEIMLTNGQDPSQILEEHDFKAASAQYVDSIINQVLKNNPKEVVAYKQGKVALLQFFVGQAMKQTKGQADASELQKLFENFLK